MIVKGRKRSTRQDLWHGGLFEKSMKVSKHITSRKINSHKKVVKYR